MRCRLKFRKGPGYLLAYVRSHETSAEIALRYMSAIQAKCADAGVDRLLVVRDIPEALGTVDIYHASLHSAETLSGIKTAIINPHPELQESLDFAVTVANNRGALYRLFDDKHEAMAWLRGEASEAPAHHASRKELSILGK